MQNITYLDNNATTRVDDSVIEIMLPYMHTEYANASSATHIPGIVSYHIIEECRATIAQLMGVEAQEIFFTSGATESINTILKGIFYKYKNKGNKILVAATEHQAVLDTCVFLKNQGAEIIYIPVDENGIVYTNFLENKIDKNTIAVVIMMANNETGVLQDMTAIAEIVHANNSILVSDTTQAIGKIPVDLKKIGIDAAVSSAHKFHGPKGIGFMYLSRKNPRVSIDPYIHGGGQERGMRSGTVNVPAVVGMTHALKIAIRDMNENNIQISNIKTLLEDRLIQKHQCTITSYTEDRLPNTIHAMIETVDNKKLLHSLKNRFAVAYGSACSSTNNGISNTLLAMGKSEKYASHSIRISLSKYTTKEEIEEFLTTFEKIL